MKTWCSIALCVAAACPAVASGDQIDGRYRGQMAEVASRYRVSQRGGALVVEATRTFRNRAELPDELRARLSTPRQSSVDAVWLRRGGRWIRGELREAGVAARRYRSSTTADPDNREGQQLALGPLLAAHGRNRIDLSLWPVPPRSTATIRYRVVAEPCLWKGRRAIQVPVEGSQRPTVAAAGGRLVTSAAERAELAENCSQIEDATGKPIVTFGFGPRPVNAWFATRPLVGGRMLTQIEVAVRRWSKKPRGARVVFVIDASRSQSDASVQAQLARAVDFAAELPDARYQIVVYRRRAEAVLPRFVRGPELAEAVKRTPRRAFERGNGSRLDRGIERALKMMDGHRGPSRVLAFTDDLLATRYQPPAFAERLPEVATAVVHVLELRSSGYQRIWKDSLAALAGRYRGVHAAVMDDPVASPGSMTALVRPRVLEAARIVATGLDDDELPDDLTLNEGDGFRDLLALSRVPDSLTLEGYLWGQVVRRPLRSSRSGQRVLPALGIAAGWLEETEARALALAGGVLSPWTSYLVESKLSHPRRPQQAVSIGTLSSVSMSHCGGCGCRGTIGRGRVGGAPTQWPLEGRARGCMALHGAGPVGLVVETTGNEVVDVRAADELPPERRALAQCLVEAAWEMQLSGRGSVRAETRLRIGGQQPVAILGASVSSYQPR